MNEINQPYGSGRTADGWDVPNCTYFTIADMEVVRQNGTGPLRGAEIFTITNSSKHGMSLKTITNTMFFTDATVECEDPVTMQILPTFRLTTRRIAGLGNSKTGTYIQYRLPPVGVHVPYFYKQLQALIVYGKNGRANQVIESSKHVSMADPLAGNWLKQTSNATIVSKEAHDPVLIVLGDQVLFAGRVWEKEKAVALFKDIVDKGCVGDIKAIMGFLYPCMYAIEGGPDPVSPSLVFNRMIELMRTVIRDHDALSKLSS